MILRPAPADYSTADQSALREALRRADSENLKRGGDIELVQGARIVLTAPSGAQFSLTVSDAGTLAAVPV